MPACLSAYQSVYPSIRLSVRRSVFLSLCLPSCLDSQLSIDLLSVAALIQNVEVSTRPSQYKAAGLHKLCPQDGRVFQPFGGPCLAENLLNWDSLGLSKTLLEMSLAVGCLRAVCAGILGASWRLLGTSLGVSGRLLGPPGTLWAAPGDCF